MFAVPCPPYSTVLDEGRTMTTKTRLEVGAMSVLAAMTCGAPAVYGQMAAGDSGARPVILTFSYTGELVQNARGGARRGTTFAGAAGGEVTLLLGRLVGWRGARPSSTACRWTARGTGLGCSRLETAPCSWARWRCSHVRKQWACPDSGASGSAVDGRVPTGGSSRSARGTTRRDSRISSTRFPTAHRCSTVAAAACTSSGT